MRFLRLLLLIGGLLAPACAHAQAQANLQVIPGSPNQLTLSVGVTPLEIGSWPTGGLFTPFANQLTKSEATTYSVLAADRGYLLTFTNIAPVTVNLTTTLYAAGFVLDVQNNGSSTVALTPSSGMINGTSSLSLSAGQGVHVAFDGTNYTAITGFSTASAGVTSIAGLTGVVTAPQAAGLFCPQGDVCVKDYGADPTGATDSTTAIQNALNAVCAGGSVTGTIRFPKGIYKVSSTMTINCAMSLLGDGDRVTFIEPSVATINVFSIPGSNPINFQRMTIIPVSGNMTSGAFLTFGTPSVENDFSIIKDSSFQNCFQCINFVSAAGWVVDRVIFQTAQTNAVEAVVQNQFHADNGDATIINSTFLSTFGNGVIGVQYISSGGLRIVNNKFNQTDTAIQMVLATGAVTGDFFIQNNSIEGYTSAAITLQRQGATGSFSFVLIQGNEFAPAGATPVAIDVPTDANGTWLNSLNILGNTIGSGSGSSTMIFVNSTNGFIVANNTLNAAANGTVMLNAGSSAAHCFLGPNIGFGATLGSSTNSAGCTTTSPF